MNFLRKTVKKISGALRVARRAFVGRDGLRIGWALLTAYAVSLLAAAGFMAGISALYEYMLGVWNLTSDNISRAPAWAQALFYNYSSISGILQGALLMGVLAALSRALLRRPFKLGAGFFKWLGIGAALAVAGVLLLRLTDSVRWGWSLLKPQIGAYTALSLCALLLSCAFEEGLWRGIVLPLLQSRLPSLGAALVCAAFSTLAYAAGGEVPALGLVNSAILAFGCALLSQSTGGFAAGAALRFGFYAVSGNIFGMASQAGAVYETYLVARDYLTGGAAGLGGGLMGAALLLLAVYLAGRGSGAWPQARAAAHGAYEKARRLYAALSGEKPPRKS